MFTHPDLIRLNKFIVVVGECWLWQGSTVNGHGHVRIKRRLKYVHRHVYITLFGYTEDDVHHKCRNRACCNPAHLGPLDHKEHGRMHGGEGKRVQQTCPTHGIPKVLHRQGGGQATLRCRECLREKQQRYRNNIKQRGK
jgi:hypothetical protein